MTKPEKAGRKLDGRFAPGASGNPAGKPKGRRHATTLAIEALLEDQHEALTRKAVELALQGDGPALRLCLDGWRRRERIPRSRSPCRLSGRQRIRSRRRRHYSRRWRGERSRRTRGAA